jgi:hypothetical protein
MSLLTLPKTKQYQVLTKEWTPAKLAPVQARYLCSPARVNYVAAGRRSFKTRAAKLRLVRAAISPQEFGDAQYFACAPTHSQTKNIFWEDIKKLVPDWAFRQNRDRSISESELRIELWNDAVIRLHGLDKPQRVEGGFWDGGVVTEYADIKPGAIASHIDPMRLRGGWIDCEGVPEGRNHFYREVQDVKKFVLNGDKDYAYHHWKTADVLWLWLGRERAAKEIALARAKLDPLTFQQEFEAEFITIEGAAYYQFSDEVHVLRDLPYDPRSPLNFCFDFNVSPGVAAVSQEHDQGNGQTATYWIGEVYIEKNSNTPMVCKKLIKDWGTHQGEIRLYGDATGGSRGSAKVAGSDWDLVRDTLRGGFQHSDGITWHVPSANPSERSRINAMNTRLMTSDGSKRMFFSSRKCPMLIRDLQGVTTVKGGSGEIDKHADRMLTHISDAAGYYVVREFPTTARDVFMEDL